MLFHILKDPKSLTPKPNYQGSMIILTYGHKLITWFGKITIPYTGNKNSRHYVSFDKQVPT